MFIAFMKKIIKYLFARYFFSLSQAGQDVWVYGEVFSKKRNGFFIDIGAYDGINLSNTYILEKRYGWEGICIEANPSLFQKLKKVRSSKSLNICLGEEGDDVYFLPKGEKGRIVSMEEAERFLGEKCIVLRTRSLTRVLEEYNAPREIDYLSIDVEGAEDIILTDFNFNRYDIRCITIERPSKSMQSVLENNGYILMKKIPNLDYFYVHRNFVERYEKNVCEFYGKKRLLLGWDRQS